MTFGRLIGITVLLTLQPAVSFSASFDCTKATTAVEKAICANPDLGRLDQEIADGYKQLLAKVDNPVKKYVQVAQRAWLKSRTDPQKLAATMQPRLKELHDSFYHAGALTFLRLMRSERPMFLLTRLPGTDLYNQWATNEWETAPDDYTPEEYEKARKECNETDCSPVVTQHYEVNFASRKILSVDKSVSEDSFGAHPANSDIYYNWWLSKAVKIAPAEIFTNKHYVEVITQAVAKYFADGADEHYDQDHGTKVALNPDNWAITAQSLHITGQGYDFGVGRDAVEIDVPWKEFGDAVNPRFRDALKVAP
jgi:uncharacterized protein YecT (DUF1311 family)